MITLRDRSQALQNKFAYDAEMRFKAEARRSKLLGFWVAGLLGKSEQDAAAYSENLVQITVGPDCEDGIFKKVAADLGDISDATTINVQMATLMATAKAQILKGL
jgi:hypothetical protein